MLFFFLFANVGVSLAQGYRTDIPLGDNLGNIAQDRGYIHIGIEDWGQWFAATKEVHERLIPGENNWPFIWVEELNDWSVAPDIHSFQLLCIRDMGWAAVERGLSCPPPQPPTPKESGRKFIKVTLDTGEEVIIEVIPDPEIGSTLCILVNAGALGYSNGVCYDDIDPEDWENVISVEVVFDISNVEDIEDCEESLPDDWIGEEDIQDNGDGEWEVSYEAVNEDPEINVLPQGHQVGYSCGEISEVVTVQ